MNVLALILAILGPVSVGWLTFRAIERIETAPPPPVDLEPIREQLRQLVDGHNALRQDLQELEHESKLAIAEGIERVDRAERRVRAAVGRARKRMEDLGYVDEGLEAEAAQLQLGDGALSEEEGVQPVRAGVASREDELRAILSSLPGDWS